MAEMEVTGAVHAESAVCQSEPLSSSFSPPPSLLLLLRLSPISFSHTPGGVKLEYGPSCWMGWASISFLQPMHSALGELQRS